LLRRQSGQHQRMKRDTPLGALARGLLAGATGTAAMTAAQQLSSRLHPNDNSEPRSGDPWGQAPAPAKAAKRVLERVFHLRVPASRIGLLTHTTHWLYGIGWGAIYGLVQEIVIAPPVRHGLLFGSGVWGASYLQLVPMGIYEPPWRYPVRMLALDASYHLVYGTFVANTYNALDKR
jgi:hypothetical protein